MILNNLHVRRFIIKNIAKYHSLKILFFSQMAFREIPRLNSTDYFPFLDVDVLHCTSHGVYMIIRIVRVYSHVNKEDILFSRKISLKVICDFNFQTVIFAIFFVIMDEHTRYIVLIKSLVRI